MRAFSSLWRGLLPRNERRKDTAGEVEPLRVAPGLDGPEEDEVDTVLTWRVGNVLDALDKSSLSMKLDELMLLLRLRLRMSANQRGISASGVRGVNDPDGGR